MDQAGGPLRTEDDETASGEIAARLVLSVRTVESHMRRIIRKTGLSNRAALAEYVQRLNGDL